MPTNTMWVEVRGSGTAECDGLYCPSKESEKVSESGTKAEAGFWNGKPAWDRVDGKATRSPSISFSATYTAWRIARLDGHLAYTVNKRDTPLPPTDCEWEVYKKGAAPAPSVILHDGDPRFSAPPNVVFVLGGPGAGKGTMCAVACEQLGWRHLSAGDLLRAERAKGGPLGDTINTIIVDGGIVPSEITVQLLRNAMLDADRAAAGGEPLNFLVDGFPRNQGNQDAWEAVVGDAATVRAMLFFECPLPVLEARILGRAEYSGRADDNVESLRKRFATYKRETMPIVELYRGRGTCIEIDSSHTRTDVWTTVKRALAPFTPDAKNDAPLTATSECHLGLRKWPKKKTKVTPLGAKAVRVALAVAGLALVATVARRR